MEPSVRLNNAGVDLLEAGNKRMARDLFKGALEVKLAMERTGFQYQPLPAPAPPQHQQGVTVTTMMDIDGNGNNDNASSSSPSLDAFLQEAAAGNAYIKRAEEHYARLQESLGRGVTAGALSSGTAVAPTSPPAPPSFICPTVTSSSNMDNSSSQSSATGSAGVGGYGQNSEPYYDQVAPNTDRRQPLFGSAFSSSRSSSGGVFNFGGNSPRTLDCDENEPFTMYTPFIYATSIRLPEDRSFTATTTTSRRDSAAIIFNLALVEHMQHRKSKQAVALYELAMTLLTGDVVDILGIALVNNIGVLCYENDDEEGALKCMGHLATFVRSNDVTIEQEKIREGLHSNILFLLNPPFAASPAA